MAYIFIHGLGQGPNSWNQVLSDMNLKAKVLRPDLPSFLSHKECNYENLYEAFCAFCQPEIEKLDLCGISLGGILALHYAISHPERVNSLVLIGTQYVMPKKLLAIQNFMFRLMSEEKFEGIGFSKKDFIQLSKTMAKLDFRSELTKIVCPTLVVCGEKDSANKKASTELAEKIPNAQLSIIEGCGHVVNQQAPGALAEQLKVFWKA